VSKVVDDVKRFVSYAKTLSGDEKGEAQVFCDRMFQAFGHGGYKEAGATLEFRLKKASGKGKSFADLVWKPRLLLEMKKSGEKLHLHYRQAFDYWLNAVPNRPRYVVLCNFDEFWIYDFDRQMDEPVDRVTLDDLARRYTALNFLFPDDRKPTFANDREPVSRKAAGQMAELFRMLTKRPKPVPRARAQRFVLQAVVAAFAEDIDLLPKDTMTGIVDDCLHRGQSAYDLFGGLFRQMNSPEAASGGRFQKVPYFNGGIFETVEPVDLGRDELELLGGDKGAATEDWSKINPVIFGTLFQHSMDKGERHALGAHYTSEAAIERVVGPTIVRPWQRRIDAASTVRDLVALRRELMDFRVLDPACGSGNFLYVAYRELVRLETRLLSRMQEIASAREFERQATTTSIISAKMFHGIEIDAFGAELAKVTLMLAKKLALDEAMETLERDQIDLPFRSDTALPLDNLNDNVVCGDALLLKWPEVDAIVGNPPYQSKNKSQQEMDVTYLNSVRHRYPGVGGRADYCVYWFRRAHDHLAQGQRAGLVGTNTIRQNYSREGGLDHIVDTGGEITEAVSSMIWPGEAVVHVSVVNWIKGDAPGAKRLWNQDGNDVNDGWWWRDLARIGPSLSFALDVTDAKAIRANAARGGCFQGQTHGHEGFLMDATEAKSAIRADRGLSKVLHPYLIANELVGMKHPKPRRYVIDFQGRDQTEATEYADLFKRVRSEVLPARKRAAQDEGQRNEKVLAANSKAKVNSHHANFLRRWWCLSWAREDMVRSLTGLSRYIACGCVTHRPIFEFVSSAIRPNAALQVFPYEDDYSFGILQSHTHWLWFTNRCSTLKSDYRYTSNTVFDSFVWPQSPSLAAAKKVAAEAVALRTKRHELCGRLGLSLRELYRAAELPGEHPLKSAHEKLEKAVRTAYGMPASADPLAFLLGLNKRAVAAEAAGKAVAGPGLPPTVGDREPFVTADFIEP
jgi:type II restriction/modification system DNA methylase subunit YeeA